MISQFFIEENPCFYKGNFAYSSVIKLGSNPSFYDKTHVFHIKTVKIDKIPIFAV